MPRCWSMSSWNVTGSAHHTRRRAFRSRLVTVRWRCGPLKPPVELSGRHCAAADWAVSSSASTTIQCFMGSPWLTVPGWAGAHCATPVLLWDNTEDPVDELLHELLHVEQTRGCHPGVRRVVPRLQEGGQLCERLAVVPPQVHSHHEDHVVTDMLKLRQASDWCLLLHYGEGMPSPRPASRERCIERRVAEVVDRVVEAGHGCGPEQYDARAVAALSDALERFFGVRGFLWCDVGGEGGAQLAYGHLVRVTFMLHHWDDDGGGHDVLHRAKPDAIVRGSPADLSEQLDHLLVTARERREVDADPCDPQPL